MSTLGVVVNPLAGGGKAVHRWAQLRDADSDLAAARVIQATDPASAREQLAAAAAEELERVIVVGGDGTVHLVGNVLLELGLADAVSIGMVPSGTGSDLARTLNIPRDSQAAMQRARTGRLRLLDVLQVQAEDGRREYALNVFSAGLPGVVDEKMMALRRRGAAASYLRATLATMFGFQPPSCRVTVDGDLWHEGPMMLLAVANSPTFGDGMKIAPGAVPDDGLADVVLAGSVPRWQLIYRLLQVYRGTHVRSRIVRAGHALRVRVEPSAVFPPFDLDGEVFEACAAEVSLVPGALRFVV
jgi:diacylglycerol kinase (ATP)